MAIVKVVFGYPIYEGGINYAANEIVPIDEESLKRYPKSEYEIVGKVKGDKQNKKKKKTKDINIEDKETVDIETEKKILS